MGDEAGVAECLVQGARDLPFPGMLWFLPPTRALWIDDFRSLPVQSGRVLATLVERAKSLGIKLREGDRFLHLEHDKNRVAGIALDNGQRIAGDEADGYESVVPPSRVGRRHSNRIEHRRRRVDVDVAHRQRY